MRYVLAAILLAGPAAGAEVRNLILEDGGSITLPVTASLEARLSRSGDQVALTGPGDREMRFDVPLFQPEIDRIAGIFGDINGDGLGDLMLRTDIGYGGVNLFYAVLVYRRGEGWVRAADVANPDFADGRSGFISEAKSGPFWYRERWDVGADGMPYLQASHQITFAGFELRRVLARDGTELDRMLVAEGQGLYDEMVPMKSVVGPEGASAQSPDPDGMAIALWLEPGTEVTLRDWDEASLLVEVETGEGTRIWIDPEALDLE